MCLCIRLQYPQYPFSGPSPSSRNIPLQGETIPASVSTCKPGFPSAASVLAAFVHLGTQTANVGVLQAVGVVFAVAFPLPPLPGHPHTFKKIHWPHTAGSKPEKKTHVWVKIHFMNSGLAKEHSDPFLWLSIRTAGTRNFLYREATDKLFAFGKY